MTQPGTPEDTTALPAADLEKAVEKFLAPLMDALRENMESTIKTRVEEMEAKLKPVVQEPEALKDKTQSALDQRVKALEAQLAAAEEARQAQEKAAQSLRFDQALGQNLDSFNPLHKGIVQELLANRIKADAVEKDGVWLTKDGKTIEEATKSFFATPEGTHFMPSQHRDGAGTKQPGQLKQEGSSISLADQLAQAFSV